MDVLAHQGGWDEIAMVLGPIVVLGGLLWVANRRAQRQEARARENAAGGDGGDGAATDRATG